MNARNASRRSPSRRLLHTSAAALVLVAGGLSGCGGSTPEHEAISKASASLHGLGVSGSEQLPSIVDRKARYDKIIKAIKPIADGAKGTTVTASGSGDAAAANQIVAQASAGLGEIAAREASDAEQNVLGHISGIRAAFNQWLGQKSVADALKSYDPTAAIAKLDAEIAAREAESAASVAEKQGQESLVAATRAKAKQARDQAATFRTQEAQIRADVANGTQTQKAAAFENAMTVKRQGDEYEKQAAGFEAEAAAQAPEVNAIDANIEKLRVQVGLLRDAKKDLNSRAEENRKQAATAAAEAADGAKNVTALIAKLDEARGHVNGPTDEAVKAYTTAVNAAKKAGGAQGLGNKGLSSVSSGSAQQSLADVLAGKARGLGAYATLLQTLSKGGQPGVSAESAAKARADADEAFKAAREAYAAAITMYEGAGGSAEAKERMSKLTEQLKKLTVEAGAGAGSAGTDGAKPSDDKPVEKPDATSKPATPAANFDAKAVETEVRAALVEMKADFSSGAVTDEKIAKWMVVKDPELSAFLQSVLGVSKKRAALDDACKSKFGKDLQTLIEESKNASVRANPMFAMMGQIINGFEDGMKNAKPDEAEITATSATAATVIDAGDPQPNKMAKIDGKWKVDLDATMGNAMGKQMMAMVKGPVAAFSKAMEGTTAKVTSGAYTDAEAMLLDLSKELMIAMQKAGGMGGGGGGGKPDGGDK